MPVEKLAVFSKRMEASSLRCDMRETRRIVELFNLATRWDTCQWNDKPGSHHEYSHVI